MGAVGFVNDIHLSLFQWDELNLLPGNGLEPKERVPLAAKITFRLWTENSFSEKEKKICNREAKASGRCIVTT